MKLLLTLLLLGCGLLPKSNKPTPSKDEHAALREKYALYLSLADAELDSYGFVRPKCDSLLFSSLASVAGLKKVNPMLAEKSPGEWHRHPSFSCYPAESKSSISKDMFVGLYLYLWKTQNKEALRRIDTYGKANNWFMGDAVDAETSVSRTLLSLPMILLLKKMLGTSLKGEEDGSGVKAGFEGHLHVLRLYITGLVNQGVSDYDLSTLKAYADSNKRNALYSAIYHKFLDGDFKDAETILLDEMLFPPTTLPTSDNYCTEYLWQRDFGGDWLPCDEGKVHPGVDFIFASSIVLGV